MVVEWRRGRSRFIGGTRFRSAPSLSHRSSVAFAPHLNREAAAEHPPGQPRQGRWRLGWRAKTPQRLNDGSRTQSDSVLGLISYCVPAGANESLHISLVFVGSVGFEGNCNPLVWIRLRAYAALVPSASKYGFLVALNELLRGKEILPYHVFHRSEPLELFWERIPESVRLVPVSECSRQIRRVDSSFGRLFEAIRPRELRRGGRF